MELARFTIEGSPTLRVSIMSKGDTFIESGCMLSKLELFSDDIHHAILWCSYRQSDPEVVFSKVVSCLVPHFA